MSFPTFDFIELSQEDVWEESELYNYLAPTKFMFVIFQERGDGAYAKGGGISKKEWRSMQDQIAKEDVHRQFYLRI